MQMWELEELQIWETQLRYIIIGLILDMWNSNESEGKEEYIMEAGAKGILGGLGLEEDAARRTHSVIINRVCWRSMKKPEEVVMLRS